MGDRGRKNKKEPEIFIENDVAIKYFDTAINGFNKLSDPKLSKGEINQTLAYKVISLMDSHKQLSTIQETIIEIINMPIAGMIGSITKNTNKYTHHLLLRYLVKCGSDEEKQLYINKKKTWKIIEFGHPWQLIKLYQALLLKEKKDDAIPLAIDAYSLSADGGPTVKIIGTVCRAIAYKWGETTWNYKKELKDLETELPKAIGKINILQQYIENKIFITEIELLQMVLPFNFH